MSTRGKIMEKIKELVKKYDENSFGRYIRKRREELGFSCRAFATKLDMSTTYLCDIENGNRKAPLRIINGKDYMSAFIKHLRIPQEEFFFFYELAAETRGVPLGVDEYLKNHKYARIALHLAREVNLSDEEWQKFISNIIEVNKVNDSL